MTTYAAGPQGTEVLRELADPEHTSYVLHEVFCERERQEAKWGQQNHRNGTGPNGTVPHEIDATFNDTACRRARERCDLAAREGTLTFEHILTEEWGEAIAESDPDSLRTELVQVAAVCVAWVEKLDRDALRSGGGV